MAWEKLSAPVGKIMNSCIANLFPACFPPLITFKEGTGVTNLVVFFPPNSAKYLYKGIFFSAAPALAKAKETARVAFAPKLDLLHPYSFLLPSNS